jgi:large subunit ribosomal protein L23
MSILKKPILTEKADNLTKKGVYGFFVDLKANKIEIKKAVEKTYGVSVESVRTIRMPGKPKSRFSRSKVISGSTSSYKKALVQLKEGESIDFYNE